MRRPRRHANKNGFGTVVVTMVAVVIVGVAVYFGATMMMKAHNKQPKTLEETAIEVLENGWILNRTETETKWQNREPERIDSYVVLYEGQRFLVQFNAATGKCLTFCNYDEGA